MYLTDLYIVLTLREIFSLKGNVIEKFSLARLHVYIYHFAYSITQFRVCRHLSKLESGTPNKKSIIEML